MWENYPVYYIRRGETNDVFKFQKFTKDILNIKIHERYLLILKIHKLYFIYIYLYFQEFNDIVSFHQSQTKSYFHVYEIASEKKSYFGCNDHQFLLYIITFNHNIKSQRNRMIQSRENAWNPQIWAI